MTASVPDLQSKSSISGPQWHALEHRIALRGANYRLRMVRFPAAWLASVDTVDGPTLGCNASPYVAVSRAVEPIGGELIDAMAIVSALRLSHQASARHTRGVLPCRSEFPQCATSPARTGLVGHGSGRNPPATPERSEPGGSHDLVRWFSARDRVSRSP